MNFKFKAEVLEKENLFIPAGFDSPTLTQELVKGSMFQDPDGNPLMFEEIVVKPDFNGNASTK
jgi:hypothetical protein